MEGGGDACMQGTGRKVRVGPERRRAEEKKK